MSRIDIESSLTADSSRLPLPSIRFLERKTPISDPLEQFAGAYMDYLQAPLQPLMDNLENDTYEGFERDPVKYRQYEEAVYQALIERNDWSENGRSVVVFVCGAGRGPLVEGCLRASQRAQVNIELTAVEKNPNAFVMYIWLIALRVARGRSQADACALACLACPQSSGAQGHAMGRCSTTGLLRYALLHSFSTGRHHC